MKNSIIFQILATGNKFPVSQKIFDFLSPKNHPRIFQAFKTKSFEDCGGQSS